MNPYIVLFLAIIFEVIGTMLLPVSQNFTKLLPSSILLFSYGISFYFLAIVTQKLPLSVVYATWSGMGVFTVALLSYIFYKQTLSWQSIVGLFLIVVGVTIVNIYKSVNYKTRSIFRKLFHSQRGVIEFAIPIQKIRACV